MTTPLRSPSALRRLNLDLLSELGFRVAPGLPLSRGPADRMRPVVEIASRLLALDLVFSWVALPEARASTERLRAHASRNQLEAWLAADELSLWSSPRPAARATALDTIGWKLENLWSLAWVLGFALPPALGDREVDQETIEALLGAFSPSLDATTEVFLAAHPPRPEAEVFTLEDLFCCAHDAVRRAQLGRDTVPESFDRSRGGAVIHERRHALSWCLSPGTGWDETDLGT